MVRGSNFYENRMYVVTHIRSSRDVILSDHPFQHHTWANVGFDLVDQVRGNAPDQSLDVLV